MEDQTTKPQPTTPIAQAPITATPPVTPIIPLQNAKTGGKNNGLVVVAIILIALISVLGILYYLIIKQSYQTTSTPATETKTTETTIKPTSTPIPTITPTDEQILQDNAIADPTQDIVPLQQDANNL